MLRNGLLICLLVFLLPVSNAENAADDSNLITETSEHKVFKSTLYRIWVKLRALNPRPQAEKAGRGQIIVTAGIRGAESTETALKPYWKDDRTADKQFVQQVEDLNTAQSMVDEGRIEEAGAALESFIARYPEGELLPNALFAQGLTLGVSGDNKGGVKVLKRFMKEYPAHPLKTDAELVISELSR